MNQLRAGIEIARDALSGALAGPVAAPEPWLEVVGVLDEALGHADEGSKQAALRKADEARGRLKMLAMMKRGPNFELMSVEDARRTALRALDDLPRSI